MTRRGKQPVVRDVTPEEAQETLFALAEMTARQPVFDLPNLRDRRAWEESQRHRPDNQRTMRF